MIAIELALAALALAAPLQVTAQYSLSKAYAGTNFFDDWDFYGAPRRRDRLASCSVQN